MNRVRNVLQTRKSSKGFTLIELMLAMGFVSVLLITIALTVIQMGTIYNRGMTLKEVNQASRDVADDLRRVIGSSQVFTVPTSGSDTDTADYIKIRTLDTHEVLGGRLCTGSYSYIWNSAKAIEGNGSQVTKYTKTNGASVTDPIAARFLKVPDVGKKYCAKNPDGSLANPVVSTADGNQAVELLQAGDHSLGLSTFSVSSTASAYDATLNKRLYTVSYTVGTGETKAMNADQSACLLPGDPSGNANITYCNVQQFTIVLRTGSAVN